MSKEKLHDKQRKEKGNRNPKTNGKTRAHLSNKWDTMHTEAMMLLSYFPGNLHYVSGEYWNKWHVTMLERAKKPLLYTVDRAK